MATVLEGIVILSDNRRSKIVTEGAHRAPNRSMLRAVGFGDEDFSKPIVGIARKLLRVK